MIMKNLNPENAEVMTLAVVFEDYRTDYVPGIGGNVALSTNADCIYEAGNGKNARGTLYISVD